MRRTRASPSRANKRMASHEARPPRAGIPKIFRLAALGIAVISLHSWRVAEWLRAATVLRRARKPALPSVSFTPSGSRMANPFQFLQEVRSEAKKVVWPTRRETMITSGLVILMVLASSLFFVVVDWVLRMGVGLMLRIGQ